MEQKKILLTCARFFPTLDLARTLSKAGHKVYVAESSPIHISRFSASVSWSFTVPSPRFHPQKYIDALEKIVKKKKIDLIIPIFEEIFYLSKGLDRLSKHCQVLSSDFPTLIELHNKYDFVKKCAHLNIDVPITHLIQKPKEIEKLEYLTPFILKPVYSRASQKIIKVTDIKNIPTIEIEKNNPWIAQEYLEGKKYCSYSIAYSGIIKAHVTYPVQFAIDGNSCLHFEAIKHDPIQNWVENFVKKTNFTGQIAFDFIEDGNNKLLTIECNPRATSGLHLLAPEKRFADVLLQKDSTPLYPKVGTQRQIAIAMLLYGWKKYSKINFFKTLFSVKDVIFSLYDVKPFLMQPVVFFHYCLQSLRLRCNLPSMFTRDIDWNGDAD